MTRLICVCSGKGGVGKTFLTANLGVALAEFGKDVAILDANLTTPNLGLHLGIPLFPVTLHDVLKGNARIHDAIYEHESGLKIIPAGLSLKDLRGVDSRDLSNALLDLIGNVEILIMDSSAGLGREALSAMESSDELIVVTNPELPSVTDALKAIKLAEQVGTRIKGIVINRVSGKSYEMSRYEIRSMLGDYEILAEIPEDKHVYHSIARRTPVVQHKPDASSSIEVKRLAAKLIGREFNYRQPWHQKIKFWR